MGLETVNNGTNAAKISELVKENPVASDSVNRGDDHIRNIKKVIKDTFSGINAEGDDAVTVTAESAELNILDGATLTTAELNILAGATALTNDLNLVHLLGDLKSGNDILNIFDTIYPTGSIYMSTASANPSTLFPNTTWAVFGEGRVLVGYDAADPDFSAGNEDGHKTHTLTTAQMPSHTHVHTVKTGRTFSSSTGSAPVVQGSNTTVLDSDPETTSSTGGDQAHNNLQPYVTVYMWTRTA